MIKYFLLILLLISTVLVSTKAIDTEFEQARKQTPQEVGLGYSDWTDACKYLKGMAFCLVYYQHCEWIAHENRCKAW